VGTPIEVPPSVRVSLTNLTAHHSAQECTMLLLNPKNHSRFYPDECSREIMLTTIEFFENKDKRRLRADDHARVLNMVRDLSKFALQLHGKPGSTPAQMEYCLRLIRKPVVDEACYQRVWSHVRALKDEHEMNP
jgi:hypothetical protein